MFWTYPRAFAGRVTLAVSLFITFSIAARADDAAPDAFTLSPVVVGATRVPTPEDQLGSTVTIITADEIAKKQQRTLPDVLQSVPGLNIVQTGGPGGTSTVFMRGTNSNHTKVFIDGIDVGDPSTPSGAFDFAHLTTADIDRIEVLRGPQSGLHGADAVGGVINIITKTGKGPAIFSGAAEVGSFSTFNQDASVSGSKNRFNYSFSATHLHSEQTPVTPDSVLPAGQKRVNDGYDNKTYATKLGGQVSDNLDLGFIARYIDSELKFTGDDSNTSIPQPGRTNSTTQQLFTRGTAHTQSFGGLLDQTLGFAYTDYTRRDLSPGSSPTHNSGDRVKEDWQGNVPLGENNIFVSGLEHQREELTGSHSAHTDTTGGFVEIQSRYDNRYFNTINLRHDDNSSFGGHTTYRVAPSMLMAESQTRLKGSVGTAYKAPSLQQLFVDFPSFGFSANPNLQPEKSVGYDAGFEQTVWDKTVKFGSTYFHNDITNLIASNDAGTTNINIGKAETYGFESFVDYKASSTVTVRGDHTYTMANNVIKDQELSRRPKHKASLTTTWQATTPLSLSATVLYVGPWIDGNRDFSISRMKTESYKLVNLAGTYDLGGGVAAFARIDNLLNTQYEDPIGFQRPGIGIFAGLRVNFGLEDDK